ncbi:prolipoprotein diacylglyceryl transferase [Motilibacter aurantiacus]|uniref:prolipoprotein diacylglyceryl transferase n=1 Tax=Motilibacter aurantiacus TaxID=2714955 RepID=UPI001408FBF7|nr:prolipoprotein diacylglyceryl transferase [Motilibacter aurantiacus]NHC45498.1 prolipoprotein diacylglyceryl transferase [Motilibacter aurantiacus]
MSPSPADAGVAVLASIPSPSEGVWHLGPLPLRAYALSILAGIVLTIVISDRRWRARGGRAGTVGDIAIWAVPFGIVGGRLYHVVTTPEPYFGSGGDPVDALKVWEGGLGIWGAIALGAVGAWIGCRQRGIALPPFADALAPGLAVAQAVGRLGNWFNQELYGRATDVPWALEIDAEHRPTETLDQATYHPAFLYELVWNLGVAALVVWADRRFRLGHGRAFALYVAAYCVGRSWIEALRVDTAEQVLGLRLNQWTAAVVFVLAVAYIAVSARLRPGREDQVEPGGVDGEPDVVAATAGSPAGTGSAGSTGSTAVMSGTAGTGGSLPGDGAHGGGGVSDASHPQAPLEGGATAEVTDPTAEAPRRE